MLENNRYLVDDWKQKRKKDLAYFRESDDNVYQLKLWRLIWLLWLRTKQGILCISAGTQCHAQILLLQKYNSTF